MKYTLEERKEIYSRPLEEQFVPMYKEGDAIVYRHLIRSTESEDYCVVFEVAKALAREKNGPIWILPEINRHESILRGLLGLSIVDGYTPDIMKDIGSFIDVKSPKVERKLSRNAGKASRQFAVACITDHQLIFNESRVDEFAKRVFGSENYQYNEVYFYVKGILSKRTKA